MVVLNGFVKIHRKLIQWGWYQDNVVKGVFLHLLLTANFTQSRWNGRTIYPGQVVVGTQRMANELGFTRQQIRTAMSKLKSTNEITTESTNRYTVVTIVNWDDYQIYEESPTNKSTNELTNEQPTDNQQITNKQPQRKNKRNKEYIYAHFDTFWAAYPRKVSKEKARKAFEKLNADEELMSKLLRSLENQKQRWTDPQYIPYPGTWLNGRRWEDETTTEAQPQKQASGYEGYRVLT